MSGMTSGLALPGFPLRGAEDVAALEACLVETVDALREHLPEGFAPRALVTLGTGLGELADAVDDAVAVSYGTLPHMPVSGAPGHRGRFVAGTIEGCPVLCMQGRVHAYEGYSPLEVSYPLRVATRLGMRALIVTNASGAINADFRPGQVVAIADHINLTGANPLAGANVAREGERFIDMTHAYSPELRVLARSVASECGYELVGGVYLGLLGPSFETPAEIRAFRAMGADLVGMSTVWEVIVAAHASLEVLGLSLVTNMAAGMLDTPISGSEIDEAAAKGAADMQAIVRGVLARM